MSSTGPEWLPLLHRAQACIEGTNVTSFLCDLTDKSPVSKDLSSADPISGYGSESGGRCSPEIDQ